MAFQFVQIIYWLALSTWFGAVLFLAIAAPIIMRSVRAQGPILPSVMSVNLEGQHGTLLGGTVIADLIRPLLRIELACFVALLVALIAQWFFISVEGLHLLSPVARSLLIVAAGVLLIYDWRVVFPSLMRYRQEYLDHADEPDIANPALERFDRYQAESVSVVRNILFLLVGVILFSAYIRPAAVSVQL
jgi:hypothetical protein